MVLMIGDLRSLYDCMHCNCVEIGLREDVTHENDGNNGLEGNLITRKSQPLTLPVPESQRDEGVLRDTGY